MNFGGSSLGIFACKKNYIRQIPGRLIGLTKDKSGHRAFCMTLQTREQHIRRGKSTSNICTNEGLIALAAVTYLSWLGSDGLENISRINFEKGQILSEAIASINGFKKRFDSIHFNEFVIECGKDPKEINKALIKKDIQGGLVIENYSGLKNCILYGITENYNDKEIKDFIKALKEVSNV
jgi:glycine dehydrogenase subunit 1